MYASVNFSTKQEFRRAVKQGMPVVLYSPHLGTAAINGPETVIGPWSDDGKAGWHAHVEVRDMRVVKVH